MVLLFDVVMFGNVIVWFAFNSVVYTSLIVTLLFGVDLRLMLVGLI